jgi:hypothetical protein
MTDYTYSGAHPIVLAGVALNSDETLGPLITVTRGADASKAIEAGKFIEQADGQSPVLYKGDVLTLPIDHAVISSLLIDGDSRYAGEPAPTPEPEPEVVEPTPAPSKRAASKTTDAPAGDDANTKEQ